MIVNEAQAVHLQSETRTWEFDGKVKDLILGTGIVNNPQFGQTIKFTFSNLPELTIQGWNDLAISDQNKIKQQLDAFGWTEKLCC